VTSFARLLRVFIVRPLRADWLRTSLTVAAVALGVAVVVAIDRAGESATGSFASSLETLLGKTDLEISAPGGVPERVLGELVTMPRRVRFAPVIETVATLPGVGAVTLYGIDALAAAADELGREASAEAQAALSPALARRLGARRGGHLTLEVEGVPQSFRVAAVLAESGSRRQDTAEFLLADLADVEAARGRYGLLDRIEGFLGPGESLDEVERDLRALLPETFAIDRPGARSAENQRMLRAFRWNLRVLSYISLVVGAFLIYNTISISVVRRRAEIGVLRALGVSRGRVLALFLGEAAGLGALGSLAGVLLGRVLAEGAVGMIAQTVDALYSSSRPSPVELTWEAAALGFCAGIAVALVSAWMPAREAMQITPASAMSRGGYESEARLRWPRRLAAAFLLAGAALLAAFAEPVDGRPVWGYVSTFLAIGAAALAAPAIVLAVHAATRRAVRAALGVEGLLASRGLVASLPRTSVVVGALGTAVAMMASVAIMVGSFRETVLVWLDQQLRADLYVRPAGRAAAGHYPPLPDALPELLRGIPGVAALDMFSALEFRYGGLRATMAGQDMRVVRDHGRFRFLAGDREAILSSLPGADRVIVSEPFAYKHRLTAGDTVELPLGPRRVRFTVAGVYYEYSSEFGYVLMDQSTWRKYLPGRGPTNLAIYVAPGADREAVRREAQRRAAPWKVLIADNQTLRDGAVTIFDRTFAITYALEAVAILVAMLGAANSLLALVLDRRREIGMLRFLGAAPAQLRRMILVEAGLVGVLANLVGMVLGFALSLLLIHVINKQSFGWTIQFHPPLGLLAGAAALITVATVAAAAYPARVAARLNPIEVVHME
jgi:putative ABC transport system permease protein